ncbi:MAG: group II truncated hemoglobin [Proteobacteria bacterium]|nr:group II truncated hemoglobin [Pseudomonadota bacterium]MCP4917790.1 group II truncated hemoglobin [Pseudomonadota bacterium]
MSAFEFLGGEAGLRELVDTFYRYMDTLPEAQAIRRMHPKDLTESADKLWMFLVGRFGGPNLYVEKHGHARLRGRHMPFAIGEDAADAWMICMDRALEDHVPAGVERDELSAFFRMVCNRMRNR